MCVSRCIPKYCVCLSDSSDCPQYECVGRPASCDKNSVEPACDTDGLVHPSLCQLQQAGKTLAYMGHCQVGSTEEQRAAGPRDCCLLQTLLLPFLIFLKHLCSTDLGTKQHQAFSDVKAKKHSAECNPSSRLDNPFS